MKNFLKNHLAYIAATGTFYLLILFSVKLNNEINIILLAVLCGILNSLTAKYITHKRNTELEKAEFKQRESYIATLNHDLKIPTLAQIQALKLLSEEKIGKINKRQQELVNLTLESCTYMYQMLSTILSTYKYENNEIHLQYENILATRLIEECFNKSIKMLENKNLNVRIKVKENSLMIPADKNEIKKAFENLINYCMSNAQENSQIICEIKQNGSNVIFSICFESPYVSSNLMQNQFKKYTTSAEKFDKVGSGPGLYLAKQIINAHNGSIKIGSSKTHNICNIKLPLINVKLEPKNSDLNIINL